MRSRFLYLLVLRQHSNANASTIVCAMRTGCWLLLTMIVFATTSSSDVKASELRSEADAQLVYVGTYTDRDSKGIYAYTFDETTGELKSIGLAAETPNPSFLAIDSDGRHVYAANEINQFKGNAAGSVTAFATDPVTHKLIELNAVASGGTGPAYVSIDRLGSNVLAANYGGSSIASFRVLQDGRLAEATAVVQHKDAAGVAKPRVPRPHSIITSDDNRFLIVPDLGLDQVMVYRFDEATGAIGANTPPSSSSEAGSGPRHFKFHPKGNFGYVTNEYRSSITVYSYDSARGVLTPLQSVSIRPDNHQGENTAAELTIHPSGNYLYASNRGHDSIAVFSVDGRTGRLTLVEHVPAGGKKPRHFSVDPTGRWLIVANQDSDNLTVFRIDPQSGRLKRTGDDTPLSSPVFVLFAPAPSKQK